MGDNPRTDNPRIEELRRRVQADPASIAFAALAEEYRRVGLFDDAIETCSAGLKRHPSYLSAHVTLGRALIEVGRFDEAEQELQLVLRAAPENLAAIRGMADIHNRRQEGDHGTGAPPAGSQFSVLGSGSEGHEHAAIAPPEPVEAAPPPVHEPETAPPTFPTIKFKSDPEPPAAAAAVDDLPVVEVPRIRLRTENQEPRTGNQEPRTGNQEPRTENQKPENPNRELRTENRPFDRLRVAPSGVEGREPARAAQIAALEGFLAAIQAARR